MTDTTQGQDSPSDSVLFQDATSTSAETLHKFENPELPLDLPPEPKPEPKVAEPPKAPPPEVRDEDGAMVPAHRLREVAEARRQAERDRDELRARLAALQPPPPPKPQVDIFDNPPEFVDQRIQQQVMPYLERIQAEAKATAEVQSRNSAIRYYGGDKVREAYKTLETGIQNQDPLAVYVYQQALNSPDPYDTIMQWHQQVETLRAVGSDPKAYRAKTEEELLSDPTFLQKAMERARNQALSGGNNVARPVRQQVSSSPSLGDVGSGVGADHAVIEPSDEQLFRAAVNAKRR